VIPEYIARWQQAKEQKMSLAKGKSFSVVSVEKMEPIAGMIDESWYRYILECEHGRIVGTRCGTLQQVSNHAKAFTDELNYRGDNLSHSIWTRRRR
jgi:hypothetical protein